MPKDAKSLREMEDAFWGEGTVCFPDLQLEQEVIGLNCGSLNVGLRLEGHFPSAGLSVALMV